MKKIAIISLSIVWAILSQAQILNVSSIDQMSVPDKGNVIFQATAISPQGDYLLLSTDTKQGLYKWDIAMSGMTTITEDSGAGSQARISEDGLLVVYGEVTYKNKRRHEAVKSVDLATGKRQTLVKATRNLQGFDIQGGSAMTVTGGKARNHSLKKGAPAVSRPVLSHHHLKLYITRDGVTTELAPNGADKHYIWGSLSPNGQRVLYYVSGYGAFVSDIDGTHVISMGNLTAPKWWNDNIIIGMNETDDEYSIISSSIVARTLDGTEQVLTGDDVIATYPVASSQSGKIAFSTPSGEIYVINVE